MLDIQNKATHLLITLKGDVSLPVLKESINEVMDLNATLDVNVIWDFSNCILLIGQMEFYEIVDLIQQKRPAHARRSKMAIVASSGITQALISFWKNVAESLPYSIGIFMAVEEAEKWLE
ncbi:MAG: hypothetical protein GXO34_00415 [Deltaproteobacteria bacterium]|nr:hypothetical protein [Deltaproteobacteria bacterium]